MRLLALDIETSPSLVYSWGLFKQTHGLNQVVETGAVICFSAKWVGSDKGTYPGEQKPKRDGTVFYGGLAHDHEDMVHAAHDLLGQADVVLHYNGSSFDIPHLNREFVEAGLTPPPPYRQVDLYLASRKVFRFLSNKLDHVVQQLGIEGKVAHEGFDLWRKCMAGDELAWRKMEKYNRRDVVLLEELYDIILPWIPSHPNRALIDGNTGPACPRCGGTHFQRRGFAYTNVSEYPRFQCQTCGGYFRGTKRARGTGTTGVAA